MSWPGAVERTAPLFCTPYAAKKTTLVRGIWVS